jgi:hypothetical protein
MEIKMEKRQTTHGRTFHVRLTLCSATIINLMSIATTGASR